MFRVRIGAFVLCSAAFALASCSSDAATGPSDDVGSHSLIGAWSGTAVGGSRTYDVSFGDSANSNGWITYRGPYEVTGAQNGLGFATARNYENTSTVEMTIGGAFHGKFASADTIVGTVKIESVDYPITFVHGS